MTNKSDLSKNQYMLVGPLAKNGYDWWWHSFTARDEEGNEVPFFIEFFIINPALGGDKPIYGQLKQGKPSYVMVKAGCWGKNKCQLHRFFGINEAYIKKGPDYQVKVADCFASEKCLKGSISLSEEQVKAHPEYMCDAGEMSFDLTVDKKIAFNVGYGASTPFRAAEAFQMYWHAEGIKTLYQGTITLNGKKYTVSKENSFGYADKNWGRDFTSPWLWLSSCNMKSNLSGKVLENSAFDIGGGRPKIYALPLEKKLLGSFTYEGTDYEFNFSKLHTLCKTNFNVVEGEENIIWDVEMTTTKAKIIVHVECPIKDMLLVNYEAPDGVKRHNRLWNGGNGYGNIKLYSLKDKIPTLIDDVEIKNVGCEYGEYDK